MKAPWEYLEELDRNVYVVDIADHKLVYMNRYAREQFLHRDDEPYIGKTCYTLLQGLPEPCPVCTAHIQEKEKFYEWVNHNSILKKDYALRDTVIEYEGRAYRIEIAEGKDSDQMKQERNNARRFEAIVNECLVKSHVTTDPEESLRALLACLGEKLACSRIGIYEIRDNGEVMQTYGWPDWKPDGVRIPCPVQMLKCQQEEDSGIWMVPESEYFHQQMSELARRLAPQAEDAMLLVPFCRGDSIGGFLGLERCGTETAGYVWQTCKIISHFIASILEQRDLLTHLKQLSYHDQLTQALNRNALEEYKQSAATAAPTGIIYCDINDLKRVNDQMGHVYGDQLICRSYEALSSLPGEKQIYRIGGDEFLIVCSNITEESFRGLTASLKRILAARHCDITIGSAWQETGADFAALQERAEVGMYQAKREYYRHTGYNELKPKEEENTPLESFIKQYYFDVGLFLNSIAMADTEIYLYCGDMQNNVFFISDNLKEDFGFEDNLVSDFIAKLEQRIHEGDRQMHIEDTRSMVEDKKTYHDIRYRIYNRWDEIVWVHCRGILKWNADMSEPLFFSGSMTGLKREAEVDAVTGLLSLSGAFQDIAERCQEGREVVILCFTLMNFTDINQTYGHAQANKLLWELGNEFKRQLGMEFTFVRMDGLRFLALPNGPVYLNEAVRSIRQVVVDTYARRGICIVYPCAIGVLRYPRDGTSIQTLVDNAAVVIQAAKAMPEQEYVEFVPGMLKDRRANKELSLKLNASVGANFQGFHIVVQPQVYAESGRIFGGEVLLRWACDGEEVSPGIFVPALEQMGLMVTVGKWQIEQVIRLCRKILPLCPDFRLSFNISYLQIMDQDLFPFLERLLKENGVPGENLLIELTESHSDTLPKQLADFIQQCKGLGIAFALDDFGNGYSGVQMLLKHPVDLVKFDRSMLEQIAHSKEKLDFIINTIQTCHQFGKTVCVEGVENRQELTVARQTKCDFIQGFYFYKPLEIAELLRLLEGEAKRKAGQCGREDAAESRCTG